MNFIFELMSLDNPGSLDFSGPQSWIYYLFGAIFIVLTLISAFFTYRYKDSKKEYESIAHIYGPFKKFWYLNRFAFFIMLSIICAICAIVFFLINPIFLK